METKAVQSNTQSYDEIIATALKNGADDAGIIEIGRKSLREYRADLKSVLPNVQSLLILVYKLNKPAIKTIHHTMADLEFKHTWNRANEASRKISMSLTESGINSIGMPVGFPFETSKWPGKMWLTCDKLFAEEAGLGKMGVNRLVLHKEFGSGIVLGTVLLDQKVDRYDSPLTDDPCINCGLCVNVCPVGAIQKDEKFNFISCYTHNYRERLGGFQNWVEQLVESKNSSDYRRRVSDTETISMWQNLSVGPQTRCDRCMAVCPVGKRDSLEYNADKKAYLNNYLKRFNEHPETIYVLRHSDGEDHVKNRFQHKTVKQVSNGIRPSSAQSFLGSLPLAFQPGQAKDLNSTYHFTFTGQENLKGTVVIKNQAIRVIAGHEGDADLHVTADSRTWVSFLAKEKNLAVSLLTRRIKLKGSPRLLLKFAHCFPS